MWSSVFESTWRDNDTQSALGCDCASCFFSVAFFNLSSSHCPSMFSLILDFQGFTVTALLTLNMDTGGTNPGAHRDIVDVCVCVFLWLCVSSVRERRKHNKVWRQDCTEEVAIWKAEWHQSSLSQAIKARVEKSPKMSHVKPWSRVFMALKRLSLGKKNRKYCNSYSQCSCFCFLEFLYAICPFEYKVVRSFHIKSSGVSFLFVFFQKVVTLSVRVVFTLWYGILFWVLFLAGAESWLQRVQNVNSAASGTSLSFCCHPLDVQTLPPTPSWSLLSFSDLTTISCATSLLILVDLCLTLGTN